MTQPNNAGLPDRRSMLQAAGASLALAAAAFTGLGGLWGLVAPLFVCMASLGFALPTATVGALSRHAVHAASASALLGTGQFVLGAIAGALVGMLADGTARPMALLMVFGAACAVVAEACRPPPLRAAVRQPEPVAEPL